MAHHAQMALAVAEARRRTDELFQILIPDALYDRPLPERHRNIFYLGHLEAFDWNQICRGAMEMPSFHPEFDRLFEFGIDPPAGRLPQDQPSDWPSAGEVERYKGHVREAIDEVLPRAPEQILHVAIEHRLMHAETFAYMLQNMPLERKISPAVPAPRSVPPVSADMVEIPDGTVSLGRKRGDGFGWDNEYEAHCQYVPAFAIGKYKVTNGEYMAFVQAGANPPRFWVWRDRKWLQRTMFGEVLLPLDWPVYVTQQQAQAYAMWAGKDLPTEAQFHRAAYGTPEGGEADPETDGENLDFRSWDPAPVSASAPNAMGVAQMVGNGWEWTRTVFAPFPGFEPFPFYPGYSANFFDGDHYVLKGASARTAACFLRRSFRNWFRPNYPYVFAGFHCVEN